MSSAAPPATPKSLALAALRLLGYVLLVAVTTLLLTEGCIRLHARYTQSIGSRRQAEYLQTIHRRIFEAWLDPNQHDPFCPPLLVYSDHGYNDPARLQRIYETTRLPANQTWVSHDFLQPPERAQRTQYTIHSNALGFRGPQAQAAKPPGTCRIIALGSYHTFGHGVNDNETYTAYLEQYLNQTAAPGQRFEVWNGGRHAGTAIIALARMQWEIFAYQPDLIILDYGFVDPLTWSDNLMPSALRLPDGVAMDAVKAVLRATLPVWGRSYLCSNMRDNIAEGSYTKNIEVFAATMRCLVEQARQHHVPVVLVKQMVAKVPDSCYLDLCGPQVRFIDVKQVFSARPAGPQQRADFKSRETWLDEIDPEALAVSTPVPLSRNAPYRLDIFQLSALGNSVLAQGLYWEVRALLQASTPTIP